MSSEEISWIQLINTQSHIKYIKLNTYTKACII